MLKEGNIWFSGEPEMWWPINDKVLEKYDHITLEEFVSESKEWIWDSNGNFYLATEDKYCEDCMLTPSENYIFNIQFPEWCTHVICTPKEY